MFRLSAARISESNGSAAATLFLAMYICASVILAVIASLGATS
jgi:hypothetical protein